MITIGLTGNIGSGKSTVCKIFESLMIPVFYADIEAKIILTEKKVIDKLVQVFGSTIINKNGKVDNKSMASLVFSDKNKLEQLNKIIHPEVYSKFKNWIKTKKDSDYVIIEAAILFESGFNKFVDYSINVNASKNLRLKRVIERDQVNSEDVLQRMNNQFSDEEKLGLASFNIHNEGDLIIPQVMELHEKILNIKKSR